jgi:predicted nucleic acid-binding protein
MADRPEAFLDTSALFAGVWSEVGGARQVLRLAEAGLVTVIVSPQVLTEIENNLRSQAPELLGRLALLLDRIGLRLAKAAPEARYEAALALVGHPGDARLLAEAWEAGAVYFITLDRQHFLDNERPRGRLPFQLGTPGDFLLWYRQSYIEQAP